MSPARHARPALPQLVAAHPKLFRGSPPRTASWVPTGWCALVDQLCEDLEVAAGASVHLVRIDQIKEKFGALRIYLYVGDDAPTDLEPRLRAFIDAAEASSLTICDVCGASGSLITGDGRVRVACGDHSGAATTPIG